MEKSRNFNKLCKETLTTLDSMSQIWKEEILPTLARMRHKECDTLVDVHHERINSTHDGSRDVQVRDLKSLRRKKRLQQRSGV